MSRWPKLLTNIGDDRAVTYAEMAAAIADLGFNAEEYVRIDGSSIAEDRPYVGNWWMKGHLLFEKVGAAAWHVKGSDAAGGEADNTPQMRTSGTIPPSDLGASLGASGRTFDSIYVDKVYDKNGNLRWTTTGAAP